jgi:anti-sigma regulatory factor (Ser/Thr protein kinase)
VRAFKFEIGASHRAARQARHVFQSRHRALPATLADDVLLLLSELVNNAVLHGSRGEADTVEVAVEQSPTRVRIEVIDGGAGFEWAGPPTDLERCSGFGLTFVDSLADRWGIERSAGRTCVWFELSTSPTRSSALGPRGDVALPMLFGGSRKPV